MIGKTSYFPIITRQSDDWKNLLFFYKYRHRFSIKELNFSRHDGEQMLFLVLFASVITSAKEVYVSSPPGFCYIWRPTPDQKNPRPFGLEWKRGTSPCSMPCRVVSRDATHAEPPAALGTAPPLPRRPHRPRAAYRSRPWPRGSHAVNPRKATQSAMKDVPLFRSN